MNALIVVDAIVWIGVGYLMFVGASTVFGRVVGAGVTAPLAVVALSIVATATALRALGAMLYERGGRSGGPERSVWAKSIAVVLVAAMALSLVVWSIYAAVAGVQVLAGTRSGLRTVAAILLAVYCAYIVVWTGTHPNECRTVRSENR